MASVNVNKITGMFSKYVFEGKPSEVFLSSLKTAINNNVKVLLVAGDQLTGKSTLGKGLSKHYNGEFLSVGMLVTHLQNPGKLYSNQLLADIGLLICLLFLFWCIGFDSRSYPSKTRFTIKNILILNQHLETIK